MGEVGFNFLGVAGALLNQGLLMIVGLRMGYSWRWLVVPWALWLAIVSVHHWSFYRAAREAAVTFDKVWFLSNSIIVSAGFPSLVILIVFAVRGVRGPSLQMQVASHAHS